MAFVRPRSRVSSKTSVLALLAALVSAGASWTYCAGTALAPSPANLSAYLGGSTGAIAVAVRVQQERSTLLLFPATWTVGSVPAGTPCSNAGLPIGATPTKRIEARGAYRRCVKFNTAKAPPANFPRPLPPMPVSTGEGTNAADDAIGVTAVEIVDVVSWPASWTYPDAAGVPAPYPGQPCSDFPLLAGESTHKHIQTQQEDNPEGPFRCVRLKDPIAYPGP